MGSSPPTPGGKGRAWGRLCVPGRGEVPVGQERPVLPVLPGAVPGAGKSPELRSRPG